MKENEAPGQSSAHVDASQVNLPHLDCTFSKAWYLNFIDHMVIWPVGQKFVAIYDILARHAYHVSIFYMGKLVDIDILQAFLLE